MKKQYINPELTIVSFRQQHQLLAGSEITVGTPGSADDAESRLDLGLWDDDDFITE